MIRTGEFDQELSMTKWLRFILKAFRTAMWTTPFNCDSTT
jgi:hypothetical protein